MVSATRTPPRSTSRNGSRAERQDGQQSRGGVRLPSVDQHLGEEGRLSHGAELLVDCTLREHRGVERALLVEGDVGDVTAFALGIEQRFHIAALRLADLKCKDAARSKHPPRVLDQAANEGEPAWAAIESHGWCGPSVIVPDMRRVAVWASGVPGWMAWRRYRLAGSGRSATMSGENSLTSLSSLDASTPSERGTGEDA